MTPESVFVLAADALLLTHVCFVVFVVFGLVLIIAGRFFRWPWVRNPWFRIIHLSGIAIVVVQSWAGVVCPLTVWENALRAKAGDIVYSGSFISHWLETLLYYEAPLWAFVVAYTLFGAAVVASWIWVRPRPFRRK